MLFKHVFSFAKIENLSWWIKMVKNVSNYQISIGKLLSEVHIDAWTTLEAWNGGNDFGICRWRLINKFSVLNKVNIYSDGSKGNKIGDEIIWLLVISCYTRSIWSNVQLPLHFLFSEYETYSNGSNVYAKVLNMNNLRG